MSSIEYLFATTAGGILIAGFVLICLAGLVLLVSLARAAVRDWMRERRERRHARDRQWPSAK